MRITSLYPGDVYILKKNEHKDIFLQVGAGTDCGIYVGDWKDIANNYPKFRIIINQRDLKRHWKKIAHLDCVGDMAQFAIYSEKEIGNSAYFKVSLRDLDGRIEIEESEFSQIEPLAVWETTHILERLGRGRISDC